MSSKLTKQLQENLTGNIFFRSELDEIMMKNDFVVETIADKNNSKTKNEGENFVYYTNQRYKIKIEFIKGETDIENLEVNAVKYCTKQKDLSTEVYPFKNLKDIENMIDYFKMKNQWHHYLTFMLGLLLGRRVGDTLSLKWSDFYYKNGKFKDEITSLKEEKTSKITKPFIDGTTKEVLSVFIEKTGINPAVDDYENNIFNTTRAAYRKAFKKAADACGITYPVSTHSTRKTFVYWALKLNPNDSNCLYTLQRMLGHSDIQQTYNYSGMAREAEIELYKGIGSLVKDVENKKTPVIKNTPVISIKTIDLRDILLMAYEEGKNNSEKKNPAIHIESINRLMDLIEDMSVKSKSVNRL